MVKPPKNTATEGQRSPKEAERARDAILKRMLQTKPKQQKDLVAERKAKRGPKGDPPKR